MTSTRIQPETADGRRRLSEATRAKLREVGRARFAALTPEQQEAQRARLRRGAPPPPSSEGAPSGPLDDAPRARPGGDPPASRGVGNGFDRAAGPPVFRVPDFAGPDPTIEQIGPAPELEPVYGGPAVTVDQVRSLLEFPFAFAAIRRGPHWKLRPDEALMVAEPLARKINEHAIAARAIAAGGDWTVIAGGLALITWARLEEDRKHDDGARDRGAGDAGAVARAGGSHPAPGDGDGGLADGGGAGRPGGLNGFGQFSTGPVALDGTEALDSEAP
jgi:hypothetical protein